MSSTYSILKRMPVGNLISKLSWEVGIDLGTCNTLMYLKERGIVINEPTMIARTKKKKWVGLSTPKFNFAKPIAYGYKAKEMLEREPTQIEVVSPIKNGSIQDLNALEKLINYYLKLVREIPYRYPKIFKPKVIVGIATFLNPVHKRAARELLKDEGAGQVILVDQAVLSAINLGVSLETADGVMIVDVGGGKTEITVVSTGGVVVGKSINVAGKSLDQDIINFIKMKYNLTIGQLTAEKIKIQGEGVIRGRDLSSGLPKSIKVSSGEIKEAIGLSLNKIVKTVTRVLDETPPELITGILKQGIVMVGGGAKIEGLAKMIEDEVKIGANVVDEPELSVIKGCGELIENPSKLSQVKLWAND